MHFEALTAVKRRPRSELRGIKDPFSVPDAGSIGVHDVGAGCPCKSFAPCLPFGAFVNGRTPPARAILDRPGGGARRNRAFARSSSLHVSIMDEQAVHRAVARMARELVEQNEGPDNLALLGIPGAASRSPISSDPRSNAPKGSTVPIGSLDITLYRDDLMVIGPRPVIGATVLPEGGVDETAVGDRRRRTLHGPNRPGSPQRTHGLGRSGAGFALRTGGSGGERVSDPTQRCGKDHHRLPDQAVEVSVRISMAVGASTSCNFHLRRRLEQPNASLGKDLVGLESLSAEQILTILNTAEPSRESPSAESRKCPSSGEKRS